MSTLTQLPTVRKARQRRAGVVYRAIRRVPAGADRDPRAGVVHTDESVAVPVGGLSLRWYRRFIEYKPFTDSLITSLLLAGASTALAIMLAVPAALGLANTRSRIGHAATPVLLSPIAVPPLVVELSSLYYLSELGIGNSFAALLITHT
ncbi:ABC-type spermidine/putrescine transport system permease subunit II [Paraburkholderia atlantica]